MTRPFRRAAYGRALPWLPAAVLVAVFVEIGLRMMPLPRLSRLLGVELRLTSGTEEPGRVSRWHPDARDAARYRAACWTLRAWPRATSRSCLRRSLVAGCLLRRRRPALQLGVAHVGGTTVAHAWLTIDGAVLDSTAPVYTPLRRI